jgi:tetratricopeptide (TPR) repeat protein
MLWQIRSWQIWKRNTIIHVVGRTFVEGAFSPSVSLSNGEKCPFCNSDQSTNTDGEKIEQLMKRVEANDAGAIYVLGNYYYHGNFGLPQDLERAIALWNQAAKLGSSKAHYNLGNVYDDGGDLKKAKFYLEAAAMAGHEVARNNLGIMEEKSGNNERAMKHWIISASAGHHTAMRNLLVKQGVVSRDAMDSTLTAYNNACAEMRSEARDAFIRSRSN